MKKIIYLLSAMVLALPVCAAARTKPVIVSTTIDFLDMAFYDERGPKEYYSLDAYESRIKAFADAGIKKINLRTNVIGLVFHPSKYTNQYGVNGSIHYLDIARSQRLIETLKHYDPLTETIRLGHKYGMEVWCWDNITDEGGGYPLDERYIAPEYRAAYRKTDGYPLMDPYFRQRPESWAVRKPVDFAELARINFKAQSEPITKIVLTSTWKYRPEINFKKEELAIYYSFDNASFTEYTGNFNFKAAVTPEGRNQLVLDGFAILAPYIKIAPKGETWVSRPFTMVADGAKTSGKIYNARGEEVPSYWGVHLPPGAGGEPTLPSGYQKNTSLNFRVLSSTAIDYKQRQIGCFVGEYLPVQYLYGVVEFCNPDVMKHKVDRFSELAAYPFDGYMLSMNCHSDVDDPDAYSYHPAVRAKLLAETGKDIWRDELPLEKILKTRADGIAEYVEHCRKLVGDRPVRMHGWQPGTPEFGRTLGRRNMGTLPLPFERLIKNGTIDGVTMYSDFAAYFDNRITGGKPLHLAIYRTLEQNPVKHINQMKEYYENIPALDEIELYGSVMLRNDANLAMVKEIISSWEK